MVILVILLVPFLMLVIALILLRSMVRKVTSQFWLMVMIVLLDVLRLDVCYIDPPVGWIDLRLAAVSTCDFVDSSFSKLVFIYKLGKIL